MLLTAPRFHIILVACCPASLYAFEEHDIVWEGKMLLEDSIDLISLELVACRPFSPPP